MAWWNPFKPTPTKQYDKPIGPTKPKKSPPPQTKATPDHQKPSSGGQTKATPDHQKPSSGGSSRRSTSKKQTSYEGSKLQKAVDRGRSTSKSQISSKKDKPTPSDYETGVAIVTEEEAQAPGRTGNVPSWVVDTSPDRDISSAAREGTFAASTILSPGPATKAKFVYDQAAIGESKAQFEDVEKVFKKFKTSPKSFEGQEGVEVSETDKGTQYTLTPDFFKERWEGKDFYTPSVLKKIYFFYFVFFCGGG